MSGTRKRPLSDSGEESAEPCKKPVSDTGGSLDWRTPIRKPIVRITEDNYAFGLEAFFTPHRIETLCEEEHASVKVFDLLNCINSMLLEFSENPDLWKNIKLPKETLGVVRLEKDWPVDVLLKDIGKYDTSPLFLRLVKTLLFNNGFSPQNFSLFCKLGDGFSFGCQMTFALIPLLLPNNQGRTPLETLKAQGTKPSEITASLITTGQEGNIDAIIALVDDLLFQAHFGKAPERAFGRNDYDFETAAAVAAEEEAGGFGPAQTPLKNATESPTGVADLWTTGNVTP